jgi:ABC-type molybdenum transport system ATPase subunit/photorepair protein PhrA
LIRQGGAGAGKAVAGLSRSGALAGTLLLSFRKLFARRKGRNTMLVELADVKLSIRGKPILHDVDLHMESGDIMVVRRRSDQA